MRLTATTHSLELITSAAGNIGWHAVFNNLTAADSAALDGQGNILAAATTTIVSAPAAAEQRDVLNLFITNNGSGANDITIQKNAAGTLTPLFRVTLAASEDIQFSANKGFWVTDGQGRQKQASPDSLPITGRSVFMTKVGATAPEAAGVRYWPGKDAGAPGAFTVGSPGLSGRAVDGMNAADAGCFQLWTPSGALWLRRWYFIGSAATNSELIDLMLINSGIAVTTITAQTLNTVALPARDANGATAGLGIIAALLVTAATTNAGAIGNCTISYTNSAGTAGRTGTMASFPATANIGSVVPFELQAGDQGVQSVQSITLGTSLVTGAVSLILYRVIDAIAAANANIASTQPNNALGNIRIWNGAALFPLIYPSNTTAVNATSALMIEER
jgi:hypothetical protein